MSDINRLELEIFAVDSTEPAVQRTRANFRSLEEQAARTAAEINRVYGANEAQFGRAFANQVRTIQERTALTGTSGLEKVLLQNHLAIQRAAGDQGKIDSIIAKNKQLAQSYLSLDAQLSKVDLIKLAGKNSSSITATLAALDREAAGAGLSGAERIIARREATIRRLASLGANEAQIQQARTRFQKILESADKEESGAGHYAARRGLLAVKDLLEGRTQGTVIELTDIFTGTSGQGGILKGAISGLSEITGLSRGAVIGIGSVAAAFAALGIVGVASIHGIAEAGRELENVSLRTGLKVNEVQGFQFAARASGVDPGIVEKLSRGLSQVADDDSPAGKRGRNELQKLGINLRDQFGDLKPTSQILLEFSDALNKLPPGLQQTAASMEVLKRVGPEAVPFLKNLREFIGISDEIGMKFGSLDAQHAEQYELSIQKFSETMRRLKLTIEAPLASTAFEVLGWLAQVNHYVNEIPQQFWASLFFASGGTTPAELSKDILNKRLPTGDQGAKLTDRLDTDARIRRFYASQGIEGQLQEARKELSAIPEPKEGVTSGKDFADYQAAAAKVRQLELAQKNQAQGAEALLAAAKEHDQLMAESAQIAESARQKELAASLDKQGLPTAQDTANLLELAKQRAIADENREINARRYRYDEKTGQRVDLSNTPDFIAFLNKENSENLPQRIENEQAKMLADLSVKYAEFYARQRDAMGKMWEQGLDKQRQQEQALWEDVQRMEEAATERYFQDQETALNRERDLALSQLGLVDAQTLKEKQALEEKKFQIEAAYAVRSEQLQLERLNHDETVALGDLQQKYAAVLEKDPNDPNYLQARELTIQRFEDQKAELAAATNDRITLDAQRAVNERNKYEIEENRKLYDSLKQDANGLFDQLFSKTKSWADFGKELFKTVILTPVKEIFSSQVAGLFTELLTGKKVTFGEVGNGQGAFGKLGSVLGRLGLGPARFGDKDHVSKLNLPNHLGDVTLINGDGTGVSNGSVPVVIMNTGQMAQAHTQGLQQFANSSGASSGGLKASITSNIRYAISGAGSLGSRIGGIGLGALLGLGTAGASSLGSATSTITYSGGGSDSFGPGTSGLESIFGQLPGAPAFYGGSSGGTGIFQSLGNIIGGPGGTSGFAGPVAGTQSGGILSRIGGIFGGGNGGGFLSGLKGLLGQNVDGVDLGNGVGIANTGILGHLAAFGQSPLSGALGFGLALDGIRRGGIGGTLEATGGGALVGFRMGGPIGAAIGAAVGAGAALIKTFIGDDRSHTKDLVKQIYGISINNATADQIIQIAKQSYGGQISVAVRSPEVRKLLQLYAQTLAPNKQAQFVADTPHAASFVKSGGKLYQNAIYDNGSAYSYQSPLSVYGGIQTTPLPTYGPNSGGTPVIQSLQLNVNGQSASDLLAGQVANVATPSFIQSQSIAGSQASIGRSSQQTLTLQPSAITR